MASVPTCYINLIVNICVKQWKSTNQDWMEQMQMIFITTGLKCATTWFEQFLPWATNSDKYSPILILTGVLGPIATFYPTPHNGNTDGNGPKWQCAGSSCRIARRFNAPFQSSIGISIQYFKHFNLTFRTFQSVRQLITQSGATWLQPIWSP